MVPVAAVATVPGMGALGAVRVVRVVGAMPGMGVVPRAPLVPVVLVVGAHRDGQVLARVGQLPGVVTAVTVMHRRQRAVVVVTAVTVVHRGLRAGVAVVVVPVLSAVHRPRPPACPLIDTPMGYAAQPPACAPCSRFPKVRHFFIRAVARREALPAERATRG
ncbi:hypothetical protein GCM10022262_30130 [Georgenia daeguensis]|uniref:Secreted protein n=1 Tax=Georgenia daeguensis TaxID=908355 RepID=A0ABP8EXE8_9MICO